MPAPMSTTSPTTTKAIMEDPPPPPSSLAGAPEPPPVAPPWPGVDRLPAWPSPPVLAPLWLLTPPWLGPGAESVGWPPPGEFVCASAGGPATTSMRSERTEMASATRALVLRRLWGWCGFDMPRLLPRRFGGVTGPRAVDSAALFVGRLVDTTSCQTSLGARATLDAHGFNQKAANPSVPWRP